MIPEVSPVTPNPPCSFYQRYGKRALDIVCSGVAIIVLGPILGITALIVKAKLGSPILFKQKRPGAIDPNTGHEHIIEIVKFRSMSNTVDADGCLLPDVDRLTPFGRALRSISLDELPELFNILKGDMSVIGPRPLAVQYLPYYTMEERHRHDVRPGLSGLAQVNGRNAVNWEDRFSYDLEYVSNITFAGDVQIVLQTFRTVFRKENVGVRGVNNPIDFDVHRRHQWEELEEK